MNKKTAWILVAALLVGVGFAYFILGRTVEEPQPLIEDFEGALDTIQVEEAWDLEEAPADTAGADSTDPDSLE